MSAIFEPAIAEPQLKNLGITQGWLQAHAETALRDAMKPYLPKAAEKARFMNIFLSPDRLRPFLNDTFCAVLKDDAPSVARTVIFENGSRFTVGSNSPLLFMLPWSEMNGQVTYNAHIARAISALMPPKATNQERLAGKWLASKLAQTVLWETNQPRRFSCIF